MQASSKGKGLANSAAQESKYLVTFINKLIVEI
jgi:hypothetical protein